MYLEKRFKFLTCEKRYQNIVVRRAFFKIQQQILDTMHGFFLQFFQATVIKKKAVADALALGNIYDR